MRNIILLLCIFYNAAGALLAQAPCSNRCLRFDGKNDYVQLGKSPIRGAGDFTVEGWFRSADNDGLSSCLNNFERIIGCGGSRLEIGECGGVFTVYIGPRGVQSSGVPTNDGAWHHFAVLKDGSIFSVYLDGNLVLTHTVPADAAYALDNTFRIGRWPGTGGDTENWQGEIDEVRIWNSALPEAALWDTKDCQLTGKEPGLSGYYNFDQGVPGVGNPNITQLTDLTDGKNNGVLNGFDLKGDDSNWVCSGTPQAVYCGDPAQIAPALRGPAENEVIRTSKKRNLRFEWSAPYGQGQNVQYKIEVFKMSVEQGKAAKYAKPVLVFSDSIPGRLYAEVPVEKLKPAAKKLEQFSWKVTAKYASASAPCSAGCSAGQGSFFMMVDDYDVNIQVTGRALCAQPAYSSTGKVRYNVTITLKNLSLGSSGAGVPVNFWNKSMSATATLASQIAVYAGGSSVFGSISNLSPATLPSTLAYNASVTFSFTVEITPGPTVLDFQAYFHSQATDLAGNPLVSYTTVNPKIPLPPCVCRDACQEFAIQMGGSPVPIKTPSANPDFDILGINQSITVSGGTRPIIRVQAEIIYFDHYMLATPPQNCCPMMCNTKPNQHTEFIGSGTALFGAGWQNGGQPIDFTDGLAGPGDLEASTATWYSLSAAGTNMNNTNIHLDIAVPNLSGGGPATPNCECHNLCIRFTFFDKDCKVCEVVRSYSTCTPVATACR